MTQIEKDIKRYIQEIEKLLFGSRKDKQKFLAEYEKSIYENMEETRREYDYEQLVLYFGSPATVATNYACAFEPELNVAKRQNKRKKYIVSLICIFIMITCLILVLYLMQSSICFYIGSYEIEARWFPN